MRRKPYPAYKPSGVEWLGDVPEHWEVKRLRYLISKIGSGKTPSGGAEVYQSEGILFIRSQNVYDDGLRLDDAVFIDDVTDKEMAWSRVKTYDVLLNITGASLGRTCIVPQEVLPANVNQHVCIIRCKDIDVAAFLSFFLKSRIAKSLFQIAQTGSGREGLNFEQIGDFFLPLPPLPEQQAIADYLDRETGKIDMLIGKKERLIQLLKEKRTALISRAVTKGLDPTVPMKPSGVEWLGDVPEHWDEKKTRFIFRFVSGGTPSTDELDFWGGNIPWVSPKDMKTFFVEDTEDHITQDALKARATNLIAEHTLLIVMRSGILKHSMPVCVIRRAMAINQDIKALIAIAPMRSDYYARFIEGHQQQLLTEWRKEGATVESLEMEFIKNFKTVLPPLPEQEAIADFLDKETAKIDTLIARVETAMEKLKEYRTALISAAVTGKIDVREAS